MLLLLLCALRPPLGKITLNFEFCRIPYAAGIQHIHSPEYFASAHNLGPAFFKLESVDVPRFTDTKTAIAFNCSTLFVKHMHVRMSSCQPNESNLRFFKEGQALYTLRFGITPTKAFTSHRLRMELTFHSKFHKASVKSLLPIFLFFGGIEAGHRPLVKENANFTQYRRAVLRGRGSDEFWIMAERVIREYSDA